MSEFVICSNYLDLLAHLLQRTVNHTARNVRRQVYRTCQKKLFQGTDGAKWQEIETRWLHSRMSFDLMSSIHYY